MADSTWGDPGQFNSPLEAALANLGIGMPPGFQQGSPPAPAAAAPSAAPGQTSWGGPGQPNSPMDAALLAAGLTPGVNYQVSQPTVGLAGTQYANLGFHPGAVAGTAAGGLPGAGGPMGPPGPPPGAPGTLPGTFPPPRREFGPTDAQWSQFRQDSSAATQGINRMPYVFPGDQHSYQALATMPPADIFNTFYKPGAAPGAAPGAQSTASIAGLNPAEQSLLAQFGPQLGGLGAAASLGLGGLGGLGATRGGV